MNEQSVFWGKRTQARLIEVRGQTLIYGLYQRLEMDKNDVIDTQYRHCDFLVPWPNTNPSANHGNGIYSNCIKSLLAVTQL